MFKSLILVALVAVVAVHGAPAPAPAAAPEAKADPHFVHAAPVVTYAAYTPYVAASPYAVVPAGGYISPYTYYGGLGYDYAAYPYATYL